MTQSLLQHALWVGCAATIAALSAAAEAQYGTPAAPAVPRSAPSMSTPATPATPVNARTQADAKYQDALSACEAKLGNARTDCIRNAKADYDRAIAQLSGSDLPSMVAPNSSSGGVGGAGGAGARGGTTTNSSR